MRITKAKLKNRSLDIEYTEKKPFLNPEGEMIESSRDIAMKCGDICHDSLIAAFDRLKSHAVLIADVREALVVEMAIQGGKHVNEIDTEDLKSISITGFVRSGDSDDGSEGAMIILQKKTGTPDIEHHYATCQI